MIVYLFRFPTGHRLAWYRVDFSPDAPPRPQLRLVVMPRSNPNCRDCTAWMCARCSDPVAGVPMPNWIDRALSLMRVRLPA